MATNNSAQPLDIEVALTKSEKFINTYKKPLIIGFIAIIAIVLAWFGGHRWLSNREDAAQAQLALVEQYFATGQYDLALKGHFKGIFLYRCCQCGTPLCRYLLLPSRKCEEGH